MMMMMMTVRGIKSSLVVDILNLITFKLIFLGGYEI